MAAPLLKRYGVPALLWLLNRMGTEPVWRAVQAQVEGVGARQQAIRKARLSGGTFGAWIAEGRTRYVVFKDGEPIDMFPPIDGDLADALRHYDRDRLRRPDDLRTAATRRRLGERLDALRRKLHRDHGEPEQAQLQPPGRATAERVAHAALERIVADMGPLLEQLTAAPAGPYTGAGDALPQAPGVYLITDRGTPVAVGQADDLRAALRERWAQRPPAGLDVQALEVDDALRRSLLEAYAGQVLGTEP
jgi:hypothetical protein